MRKIILKISIIYILIFIIGGLPNHYIFVPIIRMGLLIFAFGLLLLCTWGLVYLYWGFKTKNNKKDRSNQYSYSVIRYNDIEVNYQWRLNGGGILLSYEFARIIRQKIGKVEHVFEYCAGPGFIGFYLLAHGLCERLTLSDVNPNAIATIKATIKQNNLEKKVAVFESNCLDSIAETEQWDLVVGNPPWNLAAKSNKNIKYDDINGVVHEKFFRDIHKFLKPNGSILFVEGEECTKTKSFQQMIDSNGLKIIETILPLKMLTLFKELNEYKDLNVFFVIFLRFCLYVREVYFMRLRTCLPTE